MMQKRAFLVEFNDGSDTVMYADSIRELLSRLKHFQWDSFMDVTGLNKPNHR